MDNFKQRFISYDYNPCFNQLTETFLQLFGSKLSRICLKMITLHDNIIHVHNKRWCISYLYVISKHDDIDKDNDRW